jgi:hypothetical protein
VRAALRRLRELRRRGRTLSMPLVACCVRVVAALEWRRLAECARWARPTALVIVCLPPRCCEAHRTASVYATAASVCWRRCSYWAAALCRAMAMRLAASLAAIVVAHWASHGSSSLCADLAQRSALRAERRLSLCSPSWESTAERLRWVLARSLAGSFHCLFRS